jgi:hypothetical protein
MLHDIYYILTPDAIQRPVKAAADTTIVLKVDGNIDNRIFQVAEEYLSNQPFCLKVQLQEPLTIRQAANIIAFFFFSNYQRSNGIPQIIIEGEHEQVVQTGIELLQQSAKAQGFSGVQVIPGASMQPIYTTSDRQMIKGVYNEWLQSAPKTSGALYISALRLEDLEIIKQDLEAEEDLFNKQNPALFTVKKQNRQLQRQVQQLEQLYKSAQNEIGNQVSHNQILRSSSQATSLQNYYNNEYEILPLWYKRLGHIIKVFMGKRSFRSLLSDRVKKYRE